MAQKFIEGQTATNPQTGQKIVYSKGRWYPMGAAGAGAAPGRLSAQEQIQLKDTRESANMMGEVTQQAERFNELNKKAPTGPIYKVPGVKAVVGMFKPEIAQMDALQARMAPAQRVPGSGTTSDRDLALFMQAIPATDRLGTANGEIVRDMRAIADRRQARAAFFDAWAQKRGTLMGAEAAWNRYQAQLNSKPATGAPGTAKARTFKLPGGGSATIEEID